MKKLFIIILFIPTTSLAFSQTAEDSTEVVVWGRIAELSDEQLNNSGPTRLIFVNKRDQAEQLANEDVSNGTPFLLLAGGIAPVIIATDPEFEKKYEIYFYEFGCTGPEDKYIMAYNEVVFEFLTKKHKTRWIKEVRKDVVGLKDWKKRN